MNESSTEPQQYKKDLIICDNLNREVVPIILQNLHKIQKLDEVFADNTKLTQLTDHFSSLITTHIFEPQNEYIAWYQQTFAGALNEFAVFVRGLTNNSAITSNRVFEVRTILENTYKTQKNINKIIC